MGETPPALLSGHWQDFDASITIFYQGIEFLLEFDFSDSTEPSLAEYRAAVHPIHNPGPGLRDAILHLVRILVHRVEAAIDRLVDASIWTQSVTLLQLLLTPHYRLNVNRYDCVSTYKQPTGPTLHLKPLCLADLDPNDITHVPRIPASDLVFPDFDPSRPSLQGAVQIRHYGMAFFKPIENGREAEIIREIGMQRRLQETNIRSECRTSAMIGITTATAGDHISGVVLRWIDASPLARIEPERRSRHSARWRMQIAMFLERMHAEGLAWGDVNEYNVLVDDKDHGGCGDAWAVDFGGKTGEDHGSEGLRQLQAEDRREFERIFNG